jgi:hypothetical protein
MATAKRTNTTNTIPETKVVTDLSDRVSHVEKIILKISPQIDEIYKVIVGNDAFQQEGLITRVKKLEEENEKSNALKNKLIGAFLVGGTVWTIIWEMVKNLILKK